MDVDSSYVALSAPYSFEPTVALDSSPTITSSSRNSGFNNLFYEPLSPRRSFESPRSQEHRKRRSLSPEPCISDPDFSSPGLTSSPSQRKLERMSSGPLFPRKPTLQGLGAPSSNFLKRPRRPVVSAIVSPSELESAYSAYPVLGSSGLSDQEDIPKGLPPTRRAFSALLPPTSFVGEPLSADESSFDGLDMSSPAQAYAKRQHVKTIRRCDGTEDFRPLTGATAMQESPSAKFMGPGLPGFGDNEAHGKILPCRRVTEDGLMRITCHTVCEIPFAASFLSDQDHLAGRSA